MRAVTEVIIFWFIFSKIKWEPGEKEFIWKQNQKHTPALFSSANPFEVWHENAIELFPCLPSGQLMAVSIASGVPYRWSPFYFNDKLVCIKLAIVNCSIKFFAKQVPRNNWPGGVAVQGRDSTNPAVRHAVDLPLTGNCVSLTHRPVTMPTGVSRLVVKEG